MQLSPFASLAPLALVSLLAGCGTAAPTPGPPSAGRYEIAVTVTRFEVPGLDAPRVADMRKMMAGSSTSTYCLSSKDAAKNGEPLFHELGEGTCYLHEFDPSRGKVDVLMSCRAVSGRQSYHLSGKVWSSGADFVATGIIANNRFPQGKAIVDRQVKMKLVADCTPPPPPPKKPKPK